jgi:hypothetical protein
MHCTVVGVVLVIILEKSNSMLLLEGERLMVKFGTFITYFFLAAFQKNLSSVFLDLQNNHTPDDECYFV